MELISDPDKRSPCMDYACDTTDDRDTIPAPPPSFLALDALDEGNELALLLAPPPKFES